MALDGIVVASITEELSRVLTGGRINRIAQPEADEILMTIKTPDGLKRLSLSASASLPYACLTEANRVSPLQAPGFCMLLRKHIGSGRITAITQPSLERIIRFTIEHLDEMGDVSHKFLILELMGKHSNLIFCREDNTILDSIKHVSGQISSVREVLPNRPYFIPDTMHKKDPLTIREQEFCSLLAASKIPLGKALYTSLTGISPTVAEDICFLSGITSDEPADSLTETECCHLYHQFTLYMDRVREGDFAPCIYFQGDSPVDYAAFPISHYNSYDRRDYPSISEVIRTYYATRNMLTRIHQKSADLRHIVQTALERNRKKYDLQLRQLADTGKRDQYRIKGELLNTYGYQAPPDAAQITVPNYYTGEELTIRLDPTITPQENAQRYFGKYNKMKRTFEALTTLTEETRSEILYLESIVNAIDMAREEADLSQIRQELTETGYLRKRPSKNRKKERFTSKPYHYLSSDGYHIYVGKNNLQNEELTFHVAGNCDWWFHAKKIPGSHVIVKTNGEKDLPDRLFEEAGRLAAYYSKGRENEKVEIDYVQKKEIKKPSGGKPGFVVYYTNYSLVVPPDISALTLAE